MVKPMTYTQEEMEDLIKKGYWQTATFADVWDRNARDHPDKEALVDSRNRLTWAQAKRRIDGIALGLLQLGIQRDQAIIIQLPSMVEWFLVRVACQKAGALQVIAPRTARQREIGHAAECCEAVGVVIPWEFAGFDYFNMLLQLRSNLPALKYIFVVGDEVPEGAISLKEMMQRPLPQKYPPGYPQQTMLGVTDVFCVRLTTGTTSFPKLNEWMAGSILAGGKAVADRLRLSSEDTIGALGPVIGGPTHGLVFNTAPQVAAKVVILERWGPEEAFKLIEEERVTVASGVPTQLIQLLEHPRLGQCDLSSLRAFVCGGSLIPPDVAKKVEETMGCRLVNQYAGGEIYTSMTSVNDQPEKRHRTVGKPFPENQIKLVNDKGQEVPPGDAGEIMVRGPSRSGGYYKDPPMTWQTFSRDGWVATGDLGKFDGQGYLTIVGRKKDIIIRGGENIYPGEVEGLLATHPKVLNVAMVGMPHPVMGERLCACVIPRPGEALTFDEMVSFLKGKGLAVFKLPERLEIMESFPLVADQKVDKRALREAVTQKLKIEGIIRISISTG